MTINIDTLLSSALPDAIRCPASCGATMATIGRTADGDDPTVLLLRDRGWQVVDGAWTCPEDLPEDRKALPGAMGRRRNPHCTTCGDIRGGAYGHQAFECTWDVRDQPDVVAQRELSQWTRGLARAWKYRDARAADGAHDEANAITEALRRISAVVSGTDVNP